MRAKLGREQAYMTHHKKLVMGVRKATQSIVANDEVETSIRKNDVLLNL